MTKKQIKTVGRGRKKQETYEDWFEPFVIVKGTKLFCISEDNRYQTIGLVRNGRAWDIHISNKGCKVIVTKVK